MAHSSAANLGGAGSVSSAILAEQFYTPDDIAKMWKIDVSTARRAFQDEPGVLKLGRANRRDGKRDYVTLRIPESILLRVYQEKSK